LPDAGNAIGRPQLIMELAGKVALVTGAGRRVGRAIAVALGSRGMQVAVHFNASEKEAAESVRLVEDAGGTARSVGMDLSEPDTPARLVDWTARTFGAIDVLVNSAAVMLRMPFGEVTPEQWEAVMSLNLRTPFFLAQAAAPHLRSRHGAIVNIADLAAFETWPGYLPHGISKAGVVYLTRALARVLAPEVRVNGIAPGSVLLPDNWNEEDASRLNRTTPLERLGSPADVTRTLLFILDSDYLTGETIIVDGGRHVRL
jgi:pteridine reductase